MIDISTETVISLADATHRLPRRREGKRPNIATLYRWAQAGCRGIVLETIQVGGTKCTSVEALQRFFESLGRVPAQQRVITKARAAAIRRADCELDAAGI